MKYLSAHIALRGC